MSQNYTIIILGYFGNFKKTYQILHNQLPTAKNNSNDVLDEDTTNTSESSAMAAGNLVAHPNGA